MIIHVKKNAEKAVIQEMAGKLEAIVVQNGDGAVLVTPSSVKTLDGKFLPAIERQIVFDTDIQLASRKYISRRELRIGKTLVIGGHHNNTAVIAGPCSVESEGQITQSAELCRELGVNILRAGCFKPRTSPYSFQGMGMEGLHLLDKVRSRYGLLIITEVRDATHVDAVIEHADLVQIGAKSMYDHGILRRCGKTNKPVLLKRGFGTTLQEFVQAAEFILSGGNPNVILCERGIRTFETKTRFTLDLCGAAYLKEYTNLPVVLDPSHAMGYAYGVHDLSLACMAMGVDGLLIETHPDPKKAKSDASQQITHDEFRKLYPELAKVANAVGRTVI